MAATTLNFPDSLSTDESEVNALVRLWSLRILVPLGGHKRFVDAQHQQLSSDPLAEFLGLGHWIFCDEDDFDRRTIVSTLKKLYRRTESSASSIRIPGGTPFLDSNSE